MSSEITITVSILLMLLSPAFGQIDCSSGSIHLTFSMNDPSMFYICLDDINYLVVKCPKNSGFISAPKLHGCVPWEDWPNKPSGGVPSCEVGTHTITYRHLNPSYYYSCKAKDTPVIIQCPDGQGYAHTDTINGCVDWDAWDWREQIP